MLLDFNAARDRFTHSGSTLYSILTHNIFSQFFLQHDPFHQYAIHGLLLVVYHSPNP